MPGKLIRTVLDFRSSILHISALERRTTTAQLINQYAHAPYINLIAILNVKTDHLWRQIVRCPADSLALVGWCMAGPAEICQVNRLVTPEQILRLYVPMDHLLLVTVLQRSTHLVDDECCLALLVAALEF